MNSAHKKIDPCIFQSAIRSIPRANLVFQSKLGFLEGISFLFPAVSHILNKYFLLASRAHEARVLWNTFQGCLWVIIHYKSQMNRCLFLGLQLVTKEIRWLSLAFACSYQASALWLRLRESEIKLISCLLSASPADSLLDEPWRNETSD
jgi:hypothetical protein